MIITATIFAISLFGFLFLAFNIWKFKKDRNKLKYFEIELNSIRHTMSVELLVLMKRRSNLLEEGYKKQLRLNRMREKSDCLSGNSLIICNKLIWKLSSRLSAIALDVKSLTDNITRLEKNVKNCF